MLHKKYIDYICLGAISLALILSSRFGLNGALGAAPVADVLTFLLALFLLVKELKGWKKKNMIS
ncbi:MAG: hypothetical protein IJY52_03420 [Anaerotignum sp.]|nr:hypothetical protein [Anaerotignum sp.]